MNVCNRCGYAIDVARVILYVEGRPMNEHHYCRPCLSRIMDALQEDVRETVARYEQAMTSGRWAGK